MWHVRVNGIIRPSKKNSTVLDWKITVAALKFSSSFLHWKKTHVFVLNRRLVLLLLFVTVASKSLLPWCILHMNRDFRPRVRFCKSSRECLKSFVYKLIKWNRHDHDPISCTRAHWHQVPLAAVHFFNTLVLHFTAHTNTSCPFESGAWDRSLTAHRYRLWCCWARARFHTSCVEELSASLCTPTN